MGIRSFPIRAASHQWTEDEYRALHVMWADPLLPTKVIEHRFGLAPRALDRPEPRRALQLPPKKTLPRRNGSALYCRPHDFAHCHPLVKQALEIVIRHRVAASKVAVQAGLHDRTSSSWHRRVPRVDTLEAFLNVLGYKLTITAISGTPD